MTLGEQDKRSLPARATSINYEIENQSKKERVNGTDSVGTF